MIEVVLGTLAETPASALLNPVAADWQAATPAARRVELAAGPEIQAQRAALGELPVGSAAITSAGDLAAQFLIHVVVRSSDEAVTRGGIRRGLQNGLRRAVEWAIPDLVTPPLGTGAGNLDAEESASVMLPAIREHLQASDYPSRVRIVVESAYELEAFERELARLPSDALPLFDDGAPLSMRPGPIAGSPAGVRPAPDAVAPPAGPGGRGPGTAALPGAAAAPREEPPAAGPG